MTAVRTAAYLQSLVRELATLPNETEWVEFKVNNANPEGIGEYISALSNAAALQERPGAYLVWGIDDDSHAIVGTTFRPQATKIGNQELESWLLQMLTPKIDYRFFEVEVDGARVVLLELECARRQPVSFKGIEYVRVGSYKKKLKEYPEKERALWRSFDRQPADRGVARENVTDDEVLRLLDYPAYFDLLGLPLPADRDGILDALEQDGITRRADAGGWGIVRFGAILLARRLDAFPGLERKAVRVIKYRGRGRLDTEREQVEAKGYANGFEGLVGFINGLIPRNEVIGPALRREVPMFPELAVREVVANALIHQDLTLTGTGPMVEIFVDRMEVTNPGAPLVETARFLDCPPRSRNEALAALMRRFGICEERGSGIDKVVSQVELFQLPAPTFEVVESFTTVTLFAHKPLKDMDKEERVRACYLHACLKYVQRDYLTNSSLRERFGIEARNAATASRLIKEAVQAGAIAPHDAGAAKSQMKYSPWWTVVSARPEGAA